MIGIHRESHWTVKLLSLSEQRKGRGKADGSKAPPWALNGDKLQAYILAQRAHTDTDHCEVIKTVMYVAQ